MEIFITELMLQTLDIRCKCQVLLPGPGVMGGWVCGVRVWKSGRKKVPRYCDDVCEVAVYYDDVNSSGCRQRQ